MRRHLSFAVILFALLPAAARAEEALSPNVVTSIKAATVFVKIKVQDLAGSGSGFVIKTKGDTAYIVTNRHVVEPKVAEVVVERRPSTGRRSTRGSRRSGMPGFPAPMPAIPPMPGPGFPGFPGSPAQEEKPRYSAHLVVHEYKNVNVDVVFQSGTKQEESIHGELVAIDPDEDLAILKVSGVKRLPQPIEFIRSSQLTETMPIYVFGFPLGDELATSKRSPAITVGKGSVSSLRTDDDGNLSVVQIDAALNHGNSGGPVVNAQGRLVGVAVARITADDSNNIGLAIPADSVTRLLQGRVDKAALHVTKDGDGCMTIHVAAPLIDPLNKVKSAEFHYVAARSVTDKPKPADPLASLPGCHKLDLKIENGMAVGTITLKKGITEVALFHQAVAVSDDGKQTHSDNASETVKFAAPPPVMPQRAFPSRAANAGAVVTGQKAAARPGGSIGIHFVGTGGLFRGMGGVVPMSNWNDESGFSFSEVALVDNSGANSGATFSLVDTAGSIWATGSRNELLNGYAASGNFQPMTLTVNGIPFARYSIYICVGDCTLGDAGKVTINGATYYYTPVGGEPVGYTQVTSTNPAMHQLGNYIEVDGLSGASQTVVMAGTTQQFSGLCSAEIVDTSSNAGSKKAAPTGTGSQGSAIVPTAPSASAGQGSIGARGSRRHAIRPAGQAGNPGIQPGNAEHIFGGRFGAQFRDVAPAKGMLVGFEVGLGKWGANDVVSALRPIYLDEQGKEQLGEQHGAVNGAAIRVRAKQGYAVGAITAKALAAIDGFSLTFMKIDKDHLDPADKYESDWVGGKGGVPETTISGNGAPAIGIVGNQNDKDCTAAGLIFATPTK